MSATMDRRGTRSRLQISPHFVTCVVLFTVVFQFSFGRCQLEELSPSTILLEVEKSCVVLFTQSNDKNVQTLYVEMHQILAGSNDVISGTAGVILEEDFRWPNGKPLQWPNQHSKTSSDVTLLLFPKRIKDRTCLITGVETNPKAEQYNGPFTVKSALEWVNFHCNTYISSTGGLTYEGMHREAILHDLFSVSHVSNFTMRDFHHQVLSPSHLKNISDREEKMIRKQHSYDSDCSKDVEGQGYCSAPQSETVNRDQVHAKPVPDADGAISEILKTVSDDFSEDPHHIPSDSRRHSSVQQMPQCERISSPPTRGQFFYNYLKKSKPVIIERAASHWDAFHKWTTEFLREHYGKKEVHIKLAPDGLFEGVDDSSNWEEYSTFTIPATVLNKLPFPDFVVVRPATMNVKFSEFLDMISSVSKMANDSNDAKPRASAYLEYSSIPNYLPELEQDIEEFPFVHGLLKRQHLNIWLSDGNTLGKLHFDPFDNFLCQIRGTKQLILFEPHDNTKMYESHIPEARLGYDPVSGRFRRKKLLDSTAMVMAPVDILNPDFRRFPAFAETRPLNCTINEGDVLFMPAFWWHEVQSYPNITERRNLAVNFWYEPFLTKEFPCAHCKLDVNPTYRHLL